MSTPSARMHIPVDVLEELAEFTGNFWSSWDQEPHIAAAIRAYMKPAPPPVETATRSDIGYQWKQVFLPAGTRPRGSGNRNAWKAVWLRFPGSPQWVLADACRALQKAATARLFDADAANTSPAALQQPAPRPTPASTTTNTAATARTPAAPGKKKTRRGKRRHKRAPDA
jgi:hypothetical protein